jgi:hypothetical protein
MSMLVLGATFMGIAAVLDFFFRLRMTQAGHKWALFLSGTFNYREYHKVRDKYGWSAWPVYTMRGLMVFGILFVCIGLVRVLAIKGCSPTKSTTQAAKQKRFSVRFMQENSLQPIVHEGREFESCRGRHSFQRISFGTED